MRMGLTKEHELHQRRFGRNVGVGLILVAVIALVFGLTVVKVTNDGPVGQQMEAVNGN
jgi:hypothetical protein